MTQKQNVREPFRGGSYRRKRSSWRSQEESETITLVIKHDLSELFTINLKCWRLMGNNILQVQVL